MAAPSEDHARFAREQLASGCDTMARLLVGLIDSKGRVAEEVHAIRKLGKSLRGGFSLFRLGKSSAKEIQAIGRLLSGPRDAVSRLNTWHKLAWNDDASATAAIVGLLDQQTHTAARRPPPEPSRGASIGSPPPAKTSMNCHRMICPHGWNSAC